jgi:hypothetical protein
MSKGSRLVNPRGGPAAEGDCPPQQVKTGLAGDPGAGPHGLLRLQPRLGYGFRAELAQEAVKLVDDLGRLC